jgi:RsiW-degrading membrane proteinase PrsW (M82 family)
MRTRNLALAGVLSLVSQGLILAVLYAVASDRPLGVSGVWRDVVLAALAVVQSAIWAAFFYVQDRTEPEPTHFVLAAFAAGMAAGALVAIPFEQTLFALPDWIHRSNTTLLIGASCVRGAIASLIVYAIVRHGFQRSSEFDEPADGMAYGAFIGSGLAAVVSLTYLAAHPDFTLFAAAQAAATNVLVYASVGALAGYLVGSTKFTARPSALAGAAAVVAGAALIGLYHVIIEYAIVSGAENGLLTGAGAAMAFALVVLGVSTVLMNRLTSRASASTGVAPRTLDVPAMTAGLILLAIGGFTAARHLQAIEFHDATQSFGFRYDPAFAASVAIPDTGVVTQASFTTIGPPDLPEIFTARTRHGATVSVQSRAGAIDVQQFLPEPFLRSAEPIGLTVKEIDVGGRRGIRLHYAYQTNSETPSPDLPRLRWVYTDVVPHGDRTYAISFEAEPDAFSAGEASYQSLLSTVTWSADPRSGGAS